MRVPEHHWRCSRWRRIDGCIVPYSFDTKITFSPEIGASLVRSVRAAKCWPLVVRAQVLAPACPCLPRMCSVCVSRVSGSWWACVVSTVFRPFASDTPAARAASALRCASRTLQGRFLYRTALRGRPVRQKTRFCTTRLGPPPQNRLWLIAEARPAASPPPTRARHCRLPPCASPNRHTTTPP